MVDGPIAEPPVQAPPAPEANDPFVLDEARFASLSPEQRAAVDPVLSEWKTRAKTELDKSQKGWEEKFKPVTEKAQALEQLVQQPQFQQWWVSQQRAAMQGQPQGQQNAIAQTRPQDFATNEEWAQALYEANSGDPGKLQGIQQRMFSMMASPIVQQLKTGQEEIRTTLEMRDLFERHPDAKTLDLIGRNAQDANDPSVSLLEMALNWAVDNKKSIEDGYQMAKKWSDSMRVGAQQEALGLVNEKKQSVTSGPSKTQSGQGVVEVADAEELMQKHMEYVLNKQTPPRFVIRPNATQSRDQRWAQRV